MSTLQTRLALAYDRINVSATKDAHAADKALAYLAGAVGQMCAEPEVMTPDRIVEAFEDAAKYTEDNR